VETGGRQGGGGQVLKGNQTPKLGAENGRVANKTKSKGSKRGRGTYWEAALDPNLELKADAEWG